MKIKVLMLSIWYPLSMSRYFEKALQHREDVELRTIGPYTGINIPWLGGMQLPIKYAKSPYYPTYPVTSVFPVSQATSLVVDWKPDLVITVDAGIRFDRKPDFGCPVVHVATDPHALDYNTARGMCDVFYNMQQSYAKAGDKYLPYAFSQYDHYYEDVNKSLDAVLIGMPYQQRVTFVNSLRNLGVTVAFENGPVYDEYRHINNSANIGLNWSSLDDLNARAFELMAMKLCPVMNRVTDLYYHFKEDVHYLGFSSIDEGIGKVLWAKNNPDKAKEIANNAHKLVWETSKYGFPQHSYDERVNTILKESL